MELRVLWRSLRRRWYLVLALGTLTVATTYVVWDRVGPTYEATGTMLVFPPSQTPGPSGDSSPGNPYLALGGVNQARDVLVRTLTSKSVADQFGEEFPDTTFEVVPDFTNSAPIILFSVESASPSDAVAALNDLMDRGPLELAALQEGLGLREEEKVTSLALTLDERPTIQHKGQLRGAILATAVMAGTGLLLIALVDALLGRARTARGVGGDASPTAPRPKKQIQRRPEQTRPAPSTLVGDSNRERRKALAIREDRT